MLGSLLCVTVTEHLPVVSHPYLPVSSQEGQSTGPPPLIPGLGQQGAQGRIPPLNPGQGPGPNKGKYMLAEEGFVYTTVMCILQLMVLLVIDTVVLELLGKLLCLLLS